jgi:hypothetical protein
MRTYPDNEIALIEPGPDGSDVIVCLLCYSENDDELPVWDIGFEMEFDDHLYEFHNLELGYNGDWHHRTRVCYTDSMR